MRDLMAIRRNQARIGGFKRVIFGTGSADVCRAENAEPTAIQHVGVAYHSGDICVPQEFLDRSDVIASLKQMSRE